MKKVLISFVIMIILACAALSACSNRYLQAEDALKALLANGYTVDYISEQSEDYSQSEYGAKLQLILSECNAGIDLANRLIESHNQENPSGSPIEHIESVSLQTLTALNIVVAYKGNVQLRDFEYAYLAYSDDEAALNDFPKLFSYCQSIFPPSDRQPKNVYGSGYYFLASQSVLNLLD